ncbi:uncharacterized protein M421DRAFT_4701 [Didymella exigua CBS 183.55]|uniref:Uncharacterized protein n=1 Tax=Didymella exigua CBS 183.55 TaxID=1150837 RepID=A0A6A5RRB8_9PLEO|nr:uncharacterized protein M421DRAFT_4701 [Didymella exigua CBS 183.55]KAF1928866.1 hypothetical protein M421DRAFT_4701 [Didymella exigua CBS 183.55]
MASSASALVSSQHFAALKAQIISLATALYGTNAPSEAAFAVLPFNTTTVLDLPASSPNRHAVALIYYTGPPAAPYSAWEMLSYADDQPSYVAGAQRLLDDMEKGLGEVIGSLVNSGDWTVRHKTIPDLAVRDPQHGATEKAGPG